MKDIQTKFDLSVGRQGRHQGGERCQRKNFGSSSTLLNSKLRSLLRALTHLQKQQLLGLHYVVQATTWGNHLSESGLQDPNMRNPCSAACWQHWQTRQGNQNGNKEPWGWRAGDAASPASGSLSVKPTGAAEGETEAKSSPWNSLFSQLWGFSPPQHGASGQTVWLLSSQHTQCVSEPYPFESKGFFIMLNAAKVYAGLYVSVSFI